MFVVLGDFFLKREKMSGTGDDDSLATLAKRGLKIDALHQLLADYATVTGRQGGQGGQNHPL